MGLDSHQGPMPWHPSVSHPSSLRQIQGQQSLSTLFLLSFKTPSVFSSFSEHPFLPRGAADSVLLARNSRFYKVVAITHLKHKVLRDCCGCCVVSYQCTP